MYQVVRHTKQNRRRATVCHSIENYPTIEAAQAFIDSCIEEQYKNCMRGWGLVDVRKTTDTATGAQVVDFLPACYVLGSLRQTFEIKAV